jgi:peptidoglycan/LPS O-acetylase OafA/YrhL
MSRRKRLALAAVALVAGVAIGYLFFTAVSAPTWTQAAYGGALGFACLQLGLGDRRSRKENG